MPDPIVEQFHTLWIHFARSDERHVPLAASGNSIVEHGTVGVSRADHPPVLESKGALGCGLPDRLHLGQTALVIEMRHHRSTRPFPMTMGAIALEPGAGAILERRG